jgi:hypothetical protein
MQGAPSAPRFAASRSSRRQTAIAAYEVLNEGSNFHRNTIGRPGDVAIVHPCFTRRNGVSFQRNRLAFLSNSQKDLQPAIEVPTLPPRPEANPFNGTNPFDGRWIFTGGGCRGAGSVSAVVKDGRVIVRGGGGNGIIHTVGAGN